MKAKYNIATATSRFQAIWQNVSLTWEQLVDKLGKTVRTNETVGQFRNMPKSEQDTIKDVGGFVGGYLNEGKRKTGFVKSRSLITLDADFAVEDFVDGVRMFADYSWCIYSTHKHTPEKPRLRLVIPLSREVDSDEYEAIARKVAEEIGIEQFDDTTYQAHRLMYWPSTSNDGEFVIEHDEIQPLDVEKYLSKYVNWKDVSSWPTSTRTDKARLSTLKKQEDPTEKKGAIGVFCRTYTIKQAIDKFLPDIYEPCTNSDRYTYKQGTSSAGLVIYDDKFAYSNHATDPANGKLCNAFDIVRIHKFSHLDSDVKPNTPTSKLPSFKATMDFVTKDKNVKLNLFNEKVITAQKEFDNTELDEDTEDNNEWALDLKMDERNGYLNTIDNLVIIMANDKIIKNKFGYNEFTYRLVVTGELPWDKEFPRIWSDADEANLRHYIEKTYAIRGKDNVKDALTITAMNNKFHPVRDYLNSLKWDGIKRLETIFCDYLGAEDNEYTRFVTRKALVAAVARIYNPGIKFDNVLTLVGRQGCGKSQIIKRLGGPWFSDSLMTVQGKEAFEQIQGFWLIEMPELSALRKAETEAIKAFTAKAEDSYRAPYERYTTVRKRQCIFIGTTNRYEFLKDPTGNRRFWPIDVHPEMATKNMWESLDENEVEQIWAEAVELYKNGESIYVDKEHLKSVVEEEQEKHFDVDPMASSVINYLDMLLPDNWDKMEIYDRRAYIQGKNDFGEIDNKGTHKMEKVCVMEIWCEVYGKEKSECKQSDSRAIKDIIMKTGEWEMSKGTLSFGKEYGTQRGFVKAVRTN